MPVNIDRLSPIRTFYFAKMPLDFISTIYHNVLRLLAMSSTSKPQWCEIPLGCVLIQVYCDRLQAQYNLEGLARMDDCYVRAIELYKVIGDKSKHEYLVAEVRAPDGTSFFLAFERGRGETIDKATHEEGDDDASTQAQSGLPEDSAPVSGALGPPPEPASQSRNHAEVLPPSKSNIVPKKSSVSKFFHIPPSSSTLASFDSSLRRRHAEDKVTFLESGKHKSKHTLFRTLSFPTPAPTLPSSSSSPSGPLPSSSTSAPPPIPSSSSSAPPPASPTPLRLYELAVLANTIHTMKPEYLLLSDNCYFYAGTIIKVLQERYTPELKVETTGSEATDKRWTVLTRHGWKGKGKGKGKGKELKSGDWHHFEIYAGEKINTAPLIEKFEKDLADFKKPVQDHEDERTARRVELEARRVESEARRVELEAAKAEIVLLKRQLQEVGVQQE